MDIAVEKYKQRRDARIKKRMDEFSENDHPRDENGRFTSGGGAKKAGNASGPVSNYSNDQLLGIIGYMARAATNYNKHNSGELTRMSSEDRDKFFKAKRSLQKYVSGESDDPKIVDTVNKYLKGKRFSFKGKSTRRLKDSDS